MTVEAFRRRYTPRDVTARGRRIRCYAAGAGEPVILVSGWPQSSYLWRDVLPGVARGRRIIAVDPPGLGDSEPPRDGYDAANIATCIDELADALGLARFALVGYDIGAWIGYAYAARYSHKLKRLALIDAAIPGIAPGDVYALTPERVKMTWHFYFNALADLPAALIAGRERFYLEWLFRARSTRKDAIDAAALDEYVRIYSAPGAMAAGFGYYRAIFDTAAQNRANAATGKLTMPVLAIGGGDWLGPTMERMIEPVASNLRVEVIPECGHFVPEEAPEHVAALLGQFLPSA